MKEIVECEVNVLIAFLNLDKIVVFKFYRNSWNSGSYIRIFYRKVYTI